MGDSITSEGKLKGWVTWFGRQIELDGVYLLYFPDKKREMTKKELDEYTTIKSWPEKLMWKGLLEADPAINPNVLKVKGRVLIEMAERGYIPMFDKYFDEASVARLIERGIPAAPTRRLSLMPVEGMKYFKEHSFMLNEKFRRR